ncbi:N-acetyltransferase [Sphingobacterium oryzagri]|uniref:N-acetyltransferase n=1 Tax=Sphingobacterium oryzagri TaxID=3025669 RepID=A0ABY7WI27_9SPHI|nr:N-acetyltransferase [Sphingobacterium sp. KACC 22765]WDF68828.1 N-acetyltransferase [Sphingobacterium sp. KACC 22765]
MTPKVTIREITIKEETILSGLALLTVDVVQHHASIGFMQPFSIEDARRFWNGVLHRVEQGKVVLLVAEDYHSAQILGTVQLVIDQPANQPHRADVAKMHVHSAARRLGIGEQLLGAIEGEAIKRGKYVLVLDTVTDSPASFLYQKMGWIKVGDIPEYALFPNGGYCSTTYFYKKLE